MTNPVRFIVEEAGGFSFEEVELSDSDLPVSLPTGRELRKTVTRYAGSYTSVQVHGQKHKPISLEGTFEDTWWGASGHALEMRAAVETIVALGQIVRMEHNETQLWGILECEFVEHTPSKIDYDLKFMPYWAEDPYQFSYTPPAEPPNDLAEALDSRLGEAKDFIENAPDGVDTSFVKDALFGLASAKNSLGNVLGYLSDVGGYADLAAEQVSMVTRTLFASIRTMNSVKDRIDNAGDSILGDTASAYIRGGDYIYDGGRLVERSLEDLVAMLRKFLEVRRPRRQRVHTVRVNDTLQRLAKLYLGDYTRWVEIADANDLDNTTLTAGSELIIPRR